MKTGTVVSPYFISVLRQFKDYYRNEDRKCLLSTYDISILRRFKDCYRNEDRKCLLSPYFSSVLRQFKDYYRHKRCFMRQANNGLANCRNGYIKNHINREYRNGYIKNHINRECRVLLDTEWPGIGMDKATPSDT